MVAIQGWCDERGTTGGVPSFYSISALEFESLYETGFASEIFLGMGGGGIWGS